MATRVVHCKREAYDVYIGRDKHAMYDFGNPFPLARGASVAERQACVWAFESWLKGEQHQDVEPARRISILQNLHRLKGKVLGCWCHPKACHGDVLAKMAEEEIS